MRMAGGLLARFKKGDSRLFGIRMVSLYLLVLGARLWTIQKFGGDIPYWDQWDAEWEDLYLRFYDGTLRLGDWFAPFNEHRILFTRLLTFGLLQLNGQWDPRLQAAVNAVLYSIVPCCLFFMVCDRTRPRLQNVYWISLAMLFSLPFGWENTLGGFQSQFYLLTASAIAALWLLANTKPYATGWCAGIALAVAALGTMASGMFASLALVSLFLLCALRERRNFLASLRSNVPTLVACCAILILGFTMTVRVKENAHFAASTVVEFLSVFARCLGWPWNDVPGWGLFAWTPFLAFTYVFHLKKIQCGNRERFTLALGIWVLLQSGAIAFSRAKIYNQPRYGDVMSLGLLTNIMCLGVVWNLPKHVLIRRLLRVTCFIWFGATSVGLLVRSYDKGAEGRGALLRINNFYTSALIASSNPTMPGLRGPDQIPFYDPIKFGRHLSDSRLRRILPVGCRGALAIETRQGFAATIPFEGFNLDGQSPFPWDPIWVFGSRERPLRFDCIIRKQVNLPFVYMLMKGTPGSLTAEDRYGNGHRVRFLTEGGPNGWRRIFVYCPGEVCALSGLTSEGPVALSSPKEMGTLSALALASTASGVYTLGAGLLVVVLLLMFEWKATNKRTLVSCERPLPLASNDRNDEDDSG